MRFGDRSDQELMELARAGVAPAFAVLFHRYAPLVHAASRQAADPLAAVTDVFTRAMRELADRDEGAAVGPWLLGLAGADRPVEPLPLSDEDLDRLWLRLHERWPDGRVPPRTLAWRRPAAVAALVLVAAVVPAVLLGTDGVNGEEELLELRAVPLPDERTEAEEPEPEDDTPDFTFPEVDEDEDPPAPTTEAAPPPEPGPDSTPAAEPAPGPPPADGSGEQEAAQPDPDGEEGTADEADEQDDEEEEDEGGLSDLIPGGDEDAQGSSEPDEPDEPEEP